MIIELKPSPHDQDELLIPMIITTKVTKYASNQLHIEDRERSSNKLRMELIYYLNKQRNII